MIQIQIEVPDDTLLIAVSGALQSIDASIVSIGGKRRAVSTPRIESTREYLVDKADEFVSKALDDIATSTSTRKRATAAAEIKAADAKIALAQAVYELDGLTDDH